MRIKRTTPTKITRRSRLIAAASGAVFAAALTLPAAAAEPSPRDRFSAAQLAAAGDAVLAADVAGTAWHVDRGRGTLVVTADSTVSRAEIAKIKRSAGDVAAALRFERTPGKIRPLVEGGDAIYALTWRCSAGFNVRRGSTYYIVTAGHCTDGAGTWYSNFLRTSVIGPTVGSSFPGNDYGLIRYSSSSASHPGTAGGVDITSAANAYLRMPVTRHGSTTGTHSGRVTGTNATVNYGNGNIVYGMIRTNVCAEPGDSGGSLRSGSRAVGLTSGGSGNCTTGGTTFFQPVIEALNAYGVNVY